MARESGEASAVARAFVDGCQRDGVPANGQGGSESFDWAYGEIYRAIVQDGELAVQFIREIIESSDDETVLEAVAVGPLEDLLRVCGLRVLPVLDVLSHDSRKFAVLLSIASVAARGRLAEALEAIEERDLGRLGE